MPKKKTSQAAFKSLTTFISPASASPKSKSEESLLKGQDKKESKTPAKPSHAKSTLTPIKSEKNKISNKKSIESSPISISPTLSSDNPAESPEEPIKELPPEPEIELNSENPIDEAEEVEAEPIKNLPRITNEDSSLLDSDEDEGNLDEHVVKLKKVNEPAVASYPKEFFIPNPDPIGDARYASNLPKNQGESSKSWHLRYLVDSNEIVQNMDEGVLLTVEYDGKLNKAFAKFYDTSDETIKFWIDTTDHEALLLSQNVESRTRTK